MKIKKLIISIFLFSGLANKSFSQDTIHWQPDYQLKWEDFQGKPDNSSAMKATSSLQIEYVIIPNRNEYYWQVNTFFTKSTSWTVNNSNNLLAHEQGHFNIAELFARKISKIFTNYKGNRIKLKENLETAFDSLMNDYDAAIYLYDKETNFSIDSLQQKAWIKKIDIEIKYLDAYKSKKGVFVF